MQVRLSEETRIFDRIKCASHQIIQIEYRINCDSWIVYSFARIKVHFFAYVLRFPVLLPFRSFYCFPKLLIVLLCRRVSKRNPYTCTNTYALAIHISSSLFLSNSSRRSSGPLIVCVRAPNLTKKNIVQFGDFQFVLILTHSMSFAEVCEYCVSLKLLRNSRTTRAVNEWVNVDPAIIFYRSNYFIIIIRSN